MPVLPPPRTTILTRREAKTSWPGELFSRRAAWRPSDRSLPAREHREGAAHYLLITVLAIRKSTAKRGSKRVKKAAAVVYVYLADGTNLNALIAVRIVDGNPEVKVVPPRDFVEILIDQFDGLAQYVFHGPSLILVTSTLAGDLIVSGATRKTTLPQVLTGRI
jgi:hypothetical protein